MSKLLLTAAILITFSPFNASSKGIDCDTLAPWSTGEPQVNLHHVFCGEINKKGRAVGYHANPQGNTPSTYVKHLSGDAKNSAGVYVWDNISLKIDGKEVRKSLSSMFPEHCSQTQIVASIQYSSAHSTSCSSPRWASCGASAPTNSNTPSQYCLGADNNTFTIATALSHNKINTGFPIYQAPQLFSKK